MSQEYHIFVPHKIPESEIPKIAETVIKYLIDKKIIASQKSKCLLGDRLGYPPAENYADVVHFAQEIFFSFNINGVEVNSGRQVFHGSDIDNILCPNCSHNIIELDWGSSIDKWYKGEENYWIECPRCKDLNPITDFEFEPTWAFGELGFTFWNWGVNVKESFVTELEILTGYKIKVVEGRV